MLKTRVCVAGGFVGVQWQNMQVAREDETCPSGSRLLYALPPIPQIV